MVGTRGSTTEYRLQRKVTGDRGWGWGPARRSKQVTRAYAGEGKSIAAGGRSRAQVSPQRARGGLHSKGGPLKWSWKGQQGYAALPDACEQGPPWRFHKCTQNAAPERMFTLRSLEWDPGQ